MELYDYQKRNVQALLRALATHRAALDASDCGTGKTPVACEIVKRLNAATLVIGPKPSLPTWERWAAALGTEVSATNYELAIRGTTPYGTWGDDGWRWHPGIQFLIFDEGHRCGGLETANADLMIAARVQNIPTLVLSATPAETPMRMRALGYLLRLHDDEANPDLLSNFGKKIVPFRRWLRSYGVRKGYFSKYEFGGTKEEQAEHMARLHAQIFPHKGVRTRISDLGDAFPETMIRAELMSLGSAEQIQALYAELAERMNEIDRRAESDKKVYCPQAGGMVDNPLTGAMRLAQKIELLKVPAYCEIAEDLIASGKSVAIFVRFKDTLDELRSRLDCDCFIDGTQVGPAGARRRQACIDRFQRDEARVIVANEASGCESVSLHDLNGVYPREGLFSCGFSARVAKQLMGRLRRAGGKSRSIQRFLFAAGTGEVRCFNALSKKLNNMGALIGEFEDSDFNPFEKLHAPLPPEAAPVQDELELEEDEDCPF